MKIKEGKKRFFLLHSIKWIQKSINRWEGSTCAEFNIKRCYVKRYEETHNATRNIYYMQRDIIFAFMTLQNRKFIEYQNMDKKFMRFHSLPMCQ